MAAPLRRYRDAHCRRLPAKRRGRLCRKKTREDIHNPSGCSPRMTLRWQKFAVPTLIVPTPPTCWPCGMWGPSGEVVRGYSSATRHSRLRALEPTYPHPWSAALAGKRVLVVHPFKTTIERQYARRAELFPGTDILPQFADLHRAGRAEAWPGPTQATPAGLMPWPPWNSKWTLHRMMSIIGAQCLPLPPTPATPATPPSLNERRPAIFWQTLG